VLGVIQAAAPPNRQVWFVRMIGCCLFGLAIGIVATWQRVGSVLVAGDFNVPFHPLNEIASLLSGWSPTGLSGGFTTFNVMQAVSPYFGLFAFGKLLFGTINAAEVVTFGSILGLAGVSMLALLWHFTRNVVAAGVGAAAYMLSPYTLINFHNGAVIGFMAYAAAPFVLLVVDHAVVDSKFRARYAICTVPLVLGLAAPATVPPFVFGEIVIPVVVLIIVRFVGSRSAGRIIRALRRLLYLALIAVATSLWWLIPTVVTLHDGVLLQGFFHSALSVQPPSMFEHTSWWSMLTGFGFWAWGLSYEGRQFFTFAPAYLSYPGLVVLTGIPLVISVMGVADYVQVARDRIGLIVFGVLMWVSGTLLGLGFQGPMHLYLWAYIHLPYAGIFRSPWKDFAGMQAMGVAILVSFAVVQLARRFVRMQKSIAVSSFLLLSGVGLFAVIISPIFGDMFQNTRANGSSSYYVRVPSYVNATSKFLDGVPNCTILLPQVAYQSYVSLSWYSGGFQTVNQLLPCTTVQAASPATVPGETVADSLAEAMELHIPVASFAQLMARYGINSVLVLSDVNVRYYGVGPPAGVFESYLNGGAKFFARHRFGKWFVYTMRVAARESGLVLANSSAVDASPLVSLGEDPFAFAAVLRGARVGVVLSPGAVERRISLGVVRQRKIAYRRIVWKPISFASIGPSGCLDTGIVNVQPPLGASVHTSKLLSGPGNGVGVELKGSLATVDCVIYPSVDPVSGYIKLGFWYRSSDSARARVSLLVSNIRTVASVSLPASPDWRFVTRSIRDFMPGEPIEVWLYCLQNGVRTCQVDYSGVALRQGMLSNGGRDYAPSMFTYNRQNTLNSGSRVSRNDGSRLVGNRLHLVGSGVLIKNVAYDPLWHLVLVPVGHVVSKAVAVHVLANGYSNAWIITGNGYYRVSTVYVGPHLILIGVFASFAALLLCAATGMVMYYRRAQQPG